MALNMLRFGLVKPLLRIHKETLGRSISAPTDLYSIEPRLLLVLISARPLPYMLRPRGLVILRVCK